MLLYRLLTIVLSPIILGHIIWLSIKNKQSKYFWQRLGFRCSHLPKNSLWFHCASVGEVNTLLPLLKNIHKRDAQLKFIITTNTVTGGKIVAQQQLDYLFHSYLPFDWRHSIKRFIATTQPRAVYIMETEIWPNLFTLCANDTAIYLINARLSKTTTSTSPWIKNLLKTSLSKVTFIYSRSESDTHAYLNLGAINQKIATTGNLKLTTALNNSKEKGSIPITGREYVLVASTHNDEEKEIYSVWKKLNRHELLIIAPRHPERSPSIQKQLNCKDLAIRSQNTSITSQTKIYLLDTIGELKNYFSKAKVTIMGGSFVPVGGHNILEPASFHSATITGPFMKNFKDELKLMLDKNAIIQVNNYDELQTSLSQILDDNEFRTSLSKQTHNLTDDAGQVLERYTDIIFEQLQ